MLFRYFPLVDSFQASSNCRSFLVTDSSWSIYSLGCLLNSEFSDSTIPIPWNIFPNDMAGNHLQPTSIGYFHAFHPARLYS